MPAHESVRRGLHGDPYKISMAWVQKILDWTPIKFDESKVLKSLRFFLIKCKIAIKSISHMSVLNHAPNMQAVVSKLSFHLHVQAKWRDQAAKTRRDGGTANFENLRLFFSTVL